MSRPVVRQFMLCERAELDAKKELYTLYNPLVVVQMPPGKAKGHTQKKFGIYTQLSDGFGEFDACVEMWSDHAGPAFEGRPIIRSPVQRLTFPHKLTVVEWVVELTDVPFPKPALYEFVVRAGGEIVRGETGFIRVLPGV
jgi:hypothetical protein